MKLKTSSDKTNEVFRDICREIMCNVIIIMNIIILYMKVQALFLNEYVDEDLNIVLSIVQY